MTSKISSKHLFTIIFIIISSTMIAGCTNENSTSNNSWNDSDSINLNNTNESSANFNSSPPSHYEAQGYCYYVVDGDTIDVEGVGRIRLVGVNTPERGQKGYQEAKDFVISQCLNKMVYLDIDDKKNYDKYGRVLAVVYVENNNINAQLLNKGLAEIMYIPPSEFNPYSWA